MTKKEYFEHLNSPNCKIMQLNPKLNLADGDSEKFNAKFVDDDVNIIITRVKTDDFDFELANAKMELFDSENNSKGLFMVNMVGLEAQTILEGETTDTYGVNVYGKNSQAGKLSERTDFRIDKYY